MKAATRIVQRFRRATLLELVEDSYSNEPTVGAVMCVLQHEEAA